MDFKICNLKQLIDKINDDLGNFCQDFAQKRKDLTNKSRTSNTHILFKFNDEERDWAINEGGGTEVQYHIFLREGEVGYGIGFNTQYVPFANEMPPIDYMRPYANAFLQIYPLWKEKLDKEGFSWIYCSLEDYSNLQDDSYYLFGKTFKLQDDVIKESDYAQMLKDIKGTLFELYCRIFNVKEQAIMDAKKIEDYTRILKSKHNIILQGAPGTGKTYSTAAISLSVLGVNDIDLTNHDKVMEKYKQLEGTQIFFTTFHQSMDYEDFVEGLKPCIQTDKDDNSIGVTYEVEDGIFKRACRFAYPYKNKDIRDCIDDYIKSIKGYNNKKEIPTKSGRSTLYVWWKEGNKTISVRSKNSKSDKGEEYSHSPLNIEKIKQRALGKGSENNWPNYAQAFIEAVKKEYAQINKPVVLIIDEINRGNVSKIFGELITLLEADKREQLFVELPYSKDKFSVPYNLYIIGTMNTTDRSTGTLDYALRRRFAFITLKADETIINSYYDANDQDLKTTSRKLFLNIRNFINSPEHLNGEMSIDDLMVGHSYFMAKNKDELKDKIQYEVCPLINEYINDGLLQVSEKEKEVAFKSWIKLEEIPSNEGTTE